MPSFSETIREAVNDFAEHGFDSEARLEEWMLRIRKAADAELVPEYQVEAQLKEALSTIYVRLIDKGGYIPRHPDIPRFTVDRVKPRLRQELTRTIFASANLIRLNRVRTIQETVQRFAGWASSVPPGGSDVVESRETQTMTRSALRQLAFEQRRVAIDQGNKLIGNLNRIIAVESGAIAMQWHQHYTRNPRIDHTARDGKWFLIKDSWAYQQGLVKPGPDGFLDDVTKPGEEIFCRCSGTYFSTLRRLPSFMLTEKGKEKLEETRRQMAAA